MWKLYRLCYANFKMEKNKIKKKLLLFQHLVPLFPHLQSRSLALRD